MENKKVLFIVPKNIKYEYIKEIAGKINAKIDVERDEKNGYEMLKKGGYDLVVSSMFSDKLNGYELISRIKEDKIDCGVIMLLSEKNEKLKKDLTKAGVFSFIKKTFDDTELTKHIEEFFKSKGGSVNVSDCNSNAGNREFVLENRVFELEQKLLSKAEELELLKKRASEINDEINETKERLDKKRKYLVNSERMISIGRIYELTSFNTNLLLISFSSNSFRS